MWALIPEEEIREIFSHLKALILIHEEMGMEPPRLSAEDLRYLEGNAALPRDNPGALGHLDTLEALKAFIGECQRCKLCRGRTNLVFGEGSPRARLMFVGEGPGREEDKVGKPFVGEAGRLLTRIIEAMGLTREGVYICNVVKCRPPKNRDPERDEIDTCIPFMKRQIDIIMPEVICILGRVAGKVILGDGFKVTRDRGKWHRYGDIAVMPTFHPAYLLRNLSAKRHVWEDVKKIMSRLGLEVKKID